jgi:hypothetical protein
MICEGCAREIKGEVVWLHSERDFVGERPGGYVPFHPECAERLKAALEKEGGDAE